MESFVHILDEGALIQEDTPPEKATATLAGVPPKQLQCSSRGLARDCSFQSPAQYPLSGPHYPGLQAAMRKHDISSCIFEAVVAHAVAKPQWYRPTSTAEALAGKV